MVFEIRKHPSLSLSPPLFSLHICIYIYMYPSTTSISWYHQHIIISWSHPLQSVRLTQQLQFLWSVNNTIITLCRMTEGLTKHIQKRVCTVKDAESIAVDMLWMSSRLTTCRILLEHCTALEHWKVSSGWMVPCGAHEMGPAVWNTWTTPHPQRQEETVLPLSGAEVTFSRRMWSPQSYLPSTVLDLLFFLTPPKYLLSQITRILLLTVGNL